MSHSSAKLGIWILSVGLLVVTHANSYYNDRSEQGANIQHAYLEPVLTEPVYTDPVQIEPLYIESIEVRFSSPEPLPSESPAEEAVKTSTPSSNKKDELFHPIIVKAASQHQIDPALVKAIIMAESGYNPKAISKRGAKGLMQLMPVTAKSLGVKDIFDPELNINAGVGYFKRLLERFDGDVKLALAAYNAGSKQVRKYKGIPPFPSTKIYIKKVFKYYELYRGQS